MDEIKQQKIKLNEDERNSTNNKNKIDRLNMILSVIDRIYQFFEYKFLSGEQPDESRLPKWVKVSRQGFNAIKMKVQNAKVNNLQARPNRNRLVTSVESNKLLQNIQHGKMTYEEASKKMTNIHGDIAMLLKLASFTPNQSKMLNILFMVDEIFTEKLKTLDKNNVGKLEIFEEKSDTEKQESDVQPDTTDMPELESEKSAAEGRSQLQQGLKILTPDQMLSRLPITLAQLKAGNISQKLINEIRQLSYSLYRSKKLTKTIYNHLINAI